MEKVASDIARRVDMALGRIEADLVLKDARILDVARGEIATGDVAIGGDRIVGVVEAYRGVREIDARGRTVVPGFVDAHVHVESTLVTPGEFDRAVLPRGTTTAVSDPHEIANVLGLEGLAYFLDSAPALAMDLRVMLSSCVPATHLETSGARLGAEDLAPLRAHPSVLGLAEMMNFPGVLARDGEVLAKLALFDGGHVDGHAPLVAGRNLNAYAGAGVRTCHESTTLEEAREKLTKGLHVFVRDGSVSKDVDALAPLLTGRTWPFVSFCTDDRNPLDIASEGHVDHLIRRAIRGGAPVLDAYRSATWAAARAFGLRDRGLVAPGYLADLVLLDDLPTCAVSAVIRRGRVVDEETFAGRRLPSPAGRRSVRLAKATAGTFRVPASAPGAVPVIGLVPGKILTDHLQIEVPVRGGARYADPARDLLKIAVLARHGKNANVGRGFVRGFGFREGALASSVGHDSHNLCVVGANDEDMAAATNRLIDLQGGFVAVRRGKVLAELPLPIAGLMSDAPFEDVRDGLVLLRAAVREMGCPLEEAFLQLAFLPLPVIPHLKITDLGLVDVDRFALVAA